VVVANTLSIHLKYVFIPLNPKRLIVSRNVIVVIAVFLDLLSAFRDESLLLQLVSRDTLPMQELALGCLQNLMTRDSDKGQRLKVEAFHEDALGCVKDFLES
jgi:hypothetical protein